MTAIDLFAGLGGFTEAARQAGIEVRWAANHWPVAVQWHNANHPQVTHSCQDLQQADWTAVPAHDLLLASPACQGHSLARGVERPGHDAARATAWAVVSAAEVHRPAAIIVENVPDFSRWVLYRAWCDALQALGYALHAEVHDAADFGVPQHRRRLFMIGVRAKAPLVLQLPTRRHRSVSTILEWESHAWSPVCRPGRSQTTLARIRRGRARFGARFVMPYYSHGSGLTGRALDRPLGTVTTRDRWAVVDGDRMRMLAPSEYRAAMGFEASYRLPKNRALAIHLLGNAVPPPMAATVLRELCRAA